MKKTLSTSLFSFIFSIIAISAGYSVEFSGDLLSKPHRIFEIGFDSSANFANNTLGLNDVLTKNIEIDLQKMASDMPKSGFDIGLNDYEKAFVNLNISSRFRFSFFTELESSVNLNVSKDLFDILGSGIELTLRLVRIFSIQWELRSRQLLRATESDSHQLISFLSCMCQKLLRIPV